jgi:hypothetical protein
MLVNLTTEPQKDVLSTALTYKLCSRVVTVTVLGRQDLTILPCSLSLPGSGSRENIIHERKRTEGSHLGMRRCHLEEKAPLDVLSSGLAAGMKNYYRFR